MRSVYHSALHEELDIDGELDYYEAGGSVVLRHDLTSGLHPAFWRAEAIYSEPAWKDGYALFLRRAQAANDATYADYLRYLAAIEITIWELRLPAYIALGKHMLKYLQPDCVQPVILHGYQALLGIWNAGKLPDCRTNDDAIAYVTDQYDCVLDFSCGYGNLARAMLAQGKRFVCSDINPKCVYYIAKTLMGYEA